LVRAVELSACDKTARPASRAGVGPPRDVAWDPATPARAALAERARTRSPGLPLVLCVPVILVFAGQIVTKQQHTRRSRRRRQERRNVHKRRRAAIKAAVQASTFDDSETVGILDTNVIESFASVHDLIAAAQEEPSKQRYRLHRVGQALRVAIYLHESGGLTMTHVGELTRKLEEHVPPEEVSYGNNYTRLWIHFIKEQLLPNWRMNDMPPDVPKHLKGSEVDSAMVEVAAKLKRSVISFEGYGHRNPAVLNAKVGLRKKAAKIGVHVLTPIEFVGGGLKVVTVQRFLREFAPSWGGPTPARDAGLAVLRLARRGRFRRLASGNLWQPLATRPSILSSSACAPRGQGLTPAALVPRYAPREA
jgi:hypothetical protein